MAEKLSVLGVFPTFTCLNKIQMAQLKNVERLKRWFSRYRFERYQVYYWMFYGGLTFLKNALSPDPYQWWEVLLTLVAVMLVIYTIVGILARKSQAVVKTIALLVGMFAAYAYLFYQLVFVWHPSLGQRIFNTAGGIALGVYLFAMFIHWFHSMVEAGLLAAIYRIRKDERHKRTLLEEKHQLELQWLMGQMEPHEQTNMLDIPYAMALKRDREIADILRELKTYWQYIQEKARDVGGAVSFAEEMTHCNRIVVINQHRFDETYITMDVPTEHCGWQVPALSISALLKNAFQYGVSWDEHAPISLTAKCSESRLEITIRNKINHHKATEKPSGIGNENIRRRLKLLYGDQARLETSDTGNGWYEAILTVYRSYKS